MSKKKKKREMVQLPMPPPVGPGQLRSMFVRVRPDVFDLLANTRDAVNSSLQPGESAVSLAAMVERCVMATLAPGAPVGDRPPRGRPGAVHELLEVHDGVVVKPRGRR
jgi:hypothetical protein